MKPNYRKEKFNDGLAIFKHDPENFEVITKIDAGAYYPIAIETPFGPIFGIEVKDFLSGPAINFKGGIPEKIVNQIDKFFDKPAQTLHKQLNIKHKIGVLMYGRQGTGKTTIAKAIMQTLIEKYGAICIDSTKLNLKLYLEVVKFVRKGNPNTLICSFFDEFEGDMNEERGFLTFLDGNDSIDNHVFIGCTNYIDKIPERIKNRPSRIRILEEVSSLPYETYHHFLSEFVKNVPKHGLDIKQMSYIAAEVGLTIDELKNSVITMILDKVDFKTAALEVMKYEGKTEDSNDLIMRFTNFYATYLNSMRINLEPEIEEEDDDEDEGI